MITNFKIYEKLGYNEEVSKLADYVWDLYKQGEREIDLIEYCKKNMSVQFNTLYLEDDNSNAVNGIMYVDRDFYNETSNNKIVINNSHKPTKSRIEHELKHIWDYIKGVKQLKDDEKLIYFKNININDEYVKSFIKIIYFIERVEIEAYFQQDIRYYKDNKNKFKNFDAFFKRSYLQRIYKFISEFDINYIVDNISEVKKQAIINMYYNNIKDNESYNAERFDSFLKKCRKYISNIFKKDDNVKIYSDEEINKFFDKFKKEVEYKKKVYLKYIGRLYSYFN